MTSASEAEPIVLRGGCVVTLSSLRVLWDLEERGFDIHLDGDELVIRPGSRLTADDRAAISRHRDELKRLVAYCESVQ